MLAVFRTFRELLAPGYYDINCLTINKRTLWCVYCRDRLIAALSFFHAMLYNPV